MGKHFKTGRQKLEKLMQQSGHFAKQSAVGIFMKKSSYATRALENGGELSKLIQVYS